MADPENPSPKTEERDEVTFEGPVDSVYLNATKDYVELDVGTGAAVAISSSGWEDVVVVGNPDILKPPKWAAVQPCARHAGSMRLCLASHYCSVQARKPWGHRHLLWGPTERRAAGF